MDRAPLFYARVADLIPDRGFRERLASLPYESVADDEDPLVDLALRFDLTGEATVFGIVRSTVPDSVALATAALVRDAVERIPPPIEPVRIRLRAVPGTKKVELLRPVRCMPHVIHDKGEKLNRLSDNIRMAGGHMWGASRNPGGIVVRVDIDPTGEILAVEFIDGHSEFTERAEAAIRESLKFDPALLNGEPVSGSLTLTLGFPVGDGDAPLPLRGGPS